MHKLIQSFRDLVTQLDAVYMGTGDEKIGEVLEESRAAYKEAQDGLQQRAEAMHGVVQAIDDAGSVVDPGEGEKRAYENELEAAIAILKELDAAAKVVAVAPVFRDGPYV